MATLFSRISDCNRIRRFKDLSISPVYTDLTVYGNTAAYRATIPRRRLMFIHDIAKWIMKYDYTSKITAALVARDLCEQRRYTRTFIHTWHVKHTEMCIKSRMDLNHHRCCHHRRRRYHRDTSLIFPNAESNLRDRKSPFNDRAPRSSICSDPRPFTVDSQLYVERIRDYYCLCGIRAKRGRFSAEDTGGSLAAKLRCDQAATTRCTAPEHRHACTRAIQAWTVCAVSLLSGWQLGYAARRVLRASRETEERNARGAAQYASFHPSVLMRIANVFEVYLSTWL